MKQMMLRTEYGTIIAECKNTDYVIQHVQIIQEFRDKMYRKAPLAIQSAQEKETCSKVIIIWCALVIRAV